MPEKFDSGDKFQNVRMAHVQVSKQGPVIQVWPPFDVNLVKLATPLKGLAVKTGVATQWAPFNTPTKKCRLAGSFAAWLSNMPPDGQGVENQC